MYYMLQIDIRCSHDTIAMYKTTHRGRYSHYSLVMSNSYWNTQQLFGALNNSTGFCFILFSLLMSSLPGNHFQYIYIYISYFFVYNVINYGKNCMVKLGAYYTRMCFQTFILFFVRLIILSLISHKSI